MNAEKKLHTLLLGVKALTEIPQKKLAENKILMEEIKSVVSSRFLNSIVNDIKNEKRLEQDFMSQKPDGNAFGFNSPEFLHTYAKYRGAAYDVLRESKATKNSYLKTVKIDEALAFNARKTNPFHSPNIKGLNETKNFKKAFDEAYNSIYSDRSLQIGTANDPTRISSYIDYSPYTWNYIDYLSIPTLAQTIDLSIQIATRQMPNIITEDVEMKEAIEKEFKRMRYPEQRQKMLKYSHLSPRGSLIIPIQDDNEHVRFNVFNDTQFTYSTSYQYSKIDFTETDTGITGIYVLGHLVQNGVTAHFLCPGFEPIYAIGKNRIYQLKDAAEAVNIYLYTIKVLCIRAQVLVQTWGGEGQNDTLLKQLQNLTNDINSSLSLSTAVKLPEGAELEILNNNLSEGFAKISPVIKEYQGMLSGIMSDYYYGSSTAYAANNFNIHATHQNIRSQIQEAQLEPIDRFVINKMLELDPRFKKWRDQIDNFDIEFESLYEPTALEKEEINSKKIDNIIKMADYPELSHIFKAEGLLDEENELPPRPEPPPEEKEDPVVD